MREAKQETSTYPYPLRASELVQTKDFFVDIEKISLSSSEQQKLSDFDQELFGKLEPLKKIKPGIHTIYPDFFLTDQGWRLFQLTYLDPDLGKKAEGLTGKDKKKFFNSLFDDLKAATATEEDFERYKKEQGIEVKAKEKPLTQQEATVLFFGIEDLTEIPTQIRRRINNISSDYARDQFIKAFQESEGEVEEIADPYRVGQVVDIEKLIEKVSGYRDLKREIKGLISESKEQEGNLSRAKSTIARIYLRYFNTLIVSNYEEGRILSTQPSLTDKEKTALEKIRFPSQRASRAMERIDHFLKGVDLRIGEDGLFETIPARLREFIEARAKMTETQETPDYQKYNAIKVNADQAKRLAEMVFQAYGFDKDGWSVYISPTQKTLSVSHRKKEVNLPKNLGRGLVDALAVLSHEVEGHVLRHDNQEREIKDFSLAKEFSTGRGGILSEAGAMLVENQAKQSICQMERLAKPYYSLVILEKQKGGSFRDCFRVFIKAYAGGSEEDLGQLMEDREKWREAWEYVYPRTLRIFGRQTPLNDESGFLPTSVPLDYLEQELVARTLFENGLGKILFLGGIDLYSIKDLQSLGVLDWDRVQEPKFVVAKDLWPKIKESLDSGKNLQETIEFLGE